MNSSNTFYGTVSGSSYGLTVAPARNDEKPRTPPGLIVTQAVQTRDGWLGQVVVDKTITWESDPCADGDDAVQEANGRVVEAFRQLFRPADPTGGAAS